MEVLNSNTHKDHRLQLSRNEWPDRCINCYEAEQSRKWKDHDGNYIASSRFARTFNMSRYIPEIVSIDKADKITGEDGSVTEYPIELDIQFGNLCNSKCIMCNPEFSNQWNDDWEKVHGTKKFMKFYELVPDHRGKLTAGNKWWESDNYWTQIKEIAPRIRLLYFLGGEPLIVPALEELLDYMIENNHAKDIVVEFHTNGTIFNQRLVNKMLKFRKIKFQISLDDTGDRHHLIRFPSNIETLKKNAQQYIDNNLPIEAFNGCIGLSTIYSPFRTLEFAKQFNTDFHFRFLYTPNEQSLKNLPKSAKLEIIKTYVQGEEITGRTGIAISNYLKEYLEFEDLAEIKKYVQFMDKLDELRGTNWRTTLADVYDLLSRHCPSAFDK